MSIPFIKQFDDFAEAMANPNPDRPIQEAVASFGRSVCDRISARPELYAPTILQSPLVAACTPYWNSQGYSEPVNVPPFTGGQCEFVRYSWEAFYTTIDGQQRSFGDSLLGPVPNGPEIIPIPPNQKRLRFSAPRWNDGTVVQWFSVTVGENALLTLDSFTVIRWDGQPDTCGDPPSEVRPGPTPAPDPGPQPPGTGPQIDIRGNPIFVLPGAIQVTPTIEVELSPGEINLGSGVGGAAPLEPLPGEEVEGEGNGEGGGENDFGEPPEGERWVGCCIHITTAPPGAGVIPQSIPHDVYPTIIGNARLKFRSGTNPPAYDTPIAKRQETSCLWEPVRGMAPVGAFVNLLPGYNYVIRPYSVPLEQ